MTITEAGHALQSSPGFQLIQQERQGAFRLASQYEVDEWECRQRRHVYDRGLWSAE
ncbi:hypothetical protein [Edaphobacter aggregans]|uniref:hypothetical protein n=1 Tax=Edaphobacter aggregans TaxID=570835 RepID=UPI001FE17484|nr:hypothetical protein [Edaphobacter aggregans]